MYIKPIFNTYPFFADFLSKDGSFVIIPTHLIILNILSKIALHFIYIIYNNNGLVNFYTYWYTKKKKI